MGKSDELTACLDKLFSSCQGSIALLQELSEALGKDRGKGSGMARVLEKVAETLAEALEPCIRGCGINREWDERCLVGEVVERVQRSLFGLSLRLEKIPRLQEETEKELAEMLVDTIYSFVEAVCIAAEHLHS